MSQLMEHFGDLLPYLTAETTQSYFKNSLSQKHLSGNFKGDRAKRVTLAKERMCQYVDSTTLMASYTSRDFFIHAFCKSEGGEFSIIKLHMFGKGNSQEGSLTLKAIRLNVTSLHISMKEEGLCLVVGTQCGQILIYSKLESGTAEVRYSKISSFSIVSMMTSSLHNSLFILAQNGVIYLFDIKQARLRYQFQSEPPLMQNQKTHMFMNISEKYIGCAFSYGRVTLWEIDPAFKAQFAKIQSNLDSEEQTDLEDSKPSNKKVPIESKRGKVMVKPRASFSCFCQEGVKWINFVGTFIALVTESNFLKIYAVSLDQKSTQCEHFCLLSQVNLLHQQGQTQQQTKFQQLESVLGFSRGILVCISRWKSNKKQVFIESKLEKYVFGSKFQIEHQQTLTLPYSWPVKDIFWCQNEQFLMARGQNRYSLFLAPQLKNY